MEVSIAQSLGIRKKTFIESSLTYFLFKVRIMVQNKSYPVQSVISYSTKFSLKISYFK